MLQQEAKDILLKYWGYNNFRKPQDLIIENILTQKNTMVLLPTGGGKSICYQIPGLLLEGITIVISPLISLIEDQVKTLKGKGVSAIAFHSQLSKAKQMLELDNIINGKYKFVYLSPEKVVSENFRAYLVNVKVAQIAIDEAHCISMWGYDFRPSYLKINELTDLFPKAKIVALTASATRTVLKDILQNLKMEDAKVFKGSFVRPNLSYEAINEENKTHKLLQLCLKHEGTGLVYTRNRKSTVEISRMLKENGIAADYYHAGLTPEERASKQNAWTQNYQQPDAIRILVCTNAFGMGIDKPDVRFVIHAEPPPSLEYYYQEAGRAGRDGEFSRCILLYNQLDFNSFDEHLKQKFPEAFFISKVYNALFNHYQIAVNMGAGLSFAFDLNSFVEKFNLETIETMHALKFLNQQGAVELGDAILSKSKVHIIATPVQLAELQAKHNPLDDIIKYILRHYGGAFSSDVAIDELEIARDAELPKSLVFKILNRLDAIKMINYSPKKRQHEILFLDDRQNNYLPDLHILAKLKTQYEKGIAGIKDFINDTQQCKNLIIAAYFDDPADLPCGVCDNCIKNKMELKNNIPFEKLVNEIKTDLEVEEERAVYIKNLQKDNMQLKLLALQDLIDRGLVTTKGNYLAWRKN